MTERPRIYADFIKLDDLGRTILICNGTWKDLARLGLDLAEGMEVVLYSDDGDPLTGEDDDLEVDGIVHYDPAAGHWVAEFDRDGFRHASDAKRPKPD